MSTATEVIERLRKALNLEGKTDVELAEALGVQKTTLSSWKGRDSIPYAICVQVAQKRNISLDWLLIGQGEMKRKSDLLIPYENIAKEYIKQWLDDFWDNAGDKERHWLEMQLELSFPQYREWLQKNEGGNPKRNAG